MRRLFTSLFLLFLFPPSLFAGPHDHWWGNGECYASDVAGVTFPIGVVLSLKAQATYERADVDALFQKVNAVFEGQLNVHLNITEFVAEPTPQVYDDPECATEPADTLRAFSNWTTGRTHVALWHLLDDCFEVPCPDACTAGVTYVVSKPCVDGLSTAITYFTHSTWTTIAHEIGHNFGADHSFTNGIKGITGGLMDYFNDTYLGLPQFNTEHAMDELCNGVAGAISRCGALAGPSTPHAQEPHAHPHETFVVQYRSSSFAAWFYLAFAFATLGCVGVYVFAVECSREGRPQHLLSP